MEGTLAALWWDNFAVGHTDHGNWMMSIRTFNPTGTNPDANAAFITALQALFDGSGPGVTGIGDRVSTAVGIDEAVTYTFNPALGRKVARTRTPVGINGIATQPTGIAQASIVVYLTTVGRTDGGKVRLWLPPFTNDTVEGGQPAGLTLDHVSDGVLTMLRSLQSAGYPAQYRHGRDTALEQITGVMLPNRFSTIESRGYPPTTNGAGPAIGYFTV